LRYLFNANEKREKVASFATLATVCAALFGFVAPLILQYFDVLIEPNHRWLLAGLSIGVPTGLAITLMTLSGAIELGHKVAEASRLKSIDKIPSLVVFRRRRDTYHNLRQ
jgi:hypothetical protein